MHTQLAKLFEQKQIEKTYVALLTGEQSNDLEINSSINKQEALSTLKVLKVVPSLRNDFVTLVEFKPQTGRTHQLRIHAKSIGHPIVGDKIYGEAGNTLLKKGMFLCAVQLEFKHPVTNKRMNVSIETPYKFHAFIARELRRWEKYN